MSNPVSLKPFNTFGLEAHADSLVRVKSVQEFQDYCSEGQFEGKKFILGGGSNILLTQNFKGVVIKNEIEGVEVVSETENEVSLKVGAGEVWHDFVLWCLDHDFYGLENLSLIPGSVGAAPIQNIGAYGVEVKDHIDQVLTLDFAGKEKSFTKEDCQFGYRESVFKTNYRDELFITHVVFRLSKQPSLKLNYGSIKDELQDMGIKAPTPKDVSQAVIRIRQSKLPDPKVLGNAGSFFKNPVISNEQFETLKSSHPTIPHYPQENGKVKVPAGWLIEQTGWKGQSLGSAGVHEHQALVIVNKGGATGAEIKALSEKVQKEVWDKYEIALTPEVRFI